MFHETDVPFQLSQTLCDERTIRHRKMKRTNYHLISPWKIAENYFTSCKHTKVPTTEGHGFKSRNLQNKHQSCSYGFKGLYKPYIMHIYFCCYLYQFQNIKTFKFGVIMFLS